LEQQLRKAEISNNIDTMKLLKFILLLTPILTFGQQKNTDSSTVFNVYDFSDSRFDIDSSGFHGINKTDTTYYTNGKIASIGHYAVDKNSRMSGNKFGLWTKYCHNGQIESQGNYDMYSLLYYQSPKKDEELKARTRLVNGFITMKMDR